MSFSRPHQALLSSLGKLEQTVILKWETDELEGKPENVHLRKWLPQVKQVL